MFIKIQYLMSFLCVRVCILTVAIFAWSCVRVRPKNFLSFLKIRPGQAEKNEKASSLYRLRQSTIAEKMKRCAP